MFINQFYFDILQIHPDFDKEQVKQAYRKKVKENHPDLYPDELKELQKLKLIEINEAYKMVMSHLSDNKKQVTDKKHNYTFIPMYPDKEPEDDEAITIHKDEPYVYYKQGFIHFSQAVNGIMGIKNERKPLLKTDSQILNRFSNSLINLRKAESYFRKVVNNHNNSVWFVDSQKKIYKIDRFYTLYKLIISNLEKS